MPTVKKIFIQKDDCDPFNVILKHYLIGQPKGPLTSLIWITITTSYGLDLES